LKIVNIHFIQLWGKNLVVYCDMGAETRIVDEEEIAIASQWHAKHVSVAMNTGMQQ
jgi:hypothetical protein